MEGFPSLTREKLKVIESVEKLGGERKERLEMRNWGGGQGLSTHDSKIKIGLNPTKHTLIQCLIACCLNGDPARKDGGQDSQMGRTENEKQEA